MSEWKRVKLGDLYIVHNGLSKPRGAFGAGFPFLSYSTVFKNFFLPSSLDSLVLTNEKEQEAYSIRTGDVFITRTSETPNELGMSSVALKDYPSATYNGFCKRLRPITDRVYPRYIGYYLRTPGFRKCFESISGSMITRASLKNEDLLAMDVTLPPLPIQRKIAAVLGALDDKIENNRKICDNLEAQAQALFKSWFVDFEPFGGKMPSGWKMGKLGEIAEYRKQRIAVDELTVETFYSTENMPPEKQGMQPATSLPQSGEVPMCERGDVLVSNIRPYFKKICLASRRGGHSPDVLCFSALHACLRYYLYRLLWDDAFFSYVMSSAKGTKMPRGDKEQILAYKVVIPDIGNGARFNALVGPMCETIRLKEAESRTLAATRDALLPKLMSGEIDVEKVAV